MVQVRQDLSCSLWIHERRLAHTSVARPFCLSSCQYVRKADGHESCQWLLYFFLVHFLLHFLLSWWQLILHSKLPVVVFWSLVLNNTEQLWYIRTWGCMPLSTNAKNSSTICICIDFALRCEQTLCTVFLTCLASSLPFSNCHNYDSWKKNPEQTAEERKFFGWSFQPDPKYRTFHGESQEVFSSSTLEERIWLVLANLGWVDLHFYWSPRVIDLT